MAGALVPAFAERAEIGAAGGDISVPLRVPGREIGALALSGRGYSGATAASPRCWRAAWRSRSTTPS